MKGEDFVPKKDVRQPEIESGAQQWECWILPLNHWRFAFCEEKARKVKFFDYIKVTALLALHLIEHHNINQHANKQIRC